MFCFNKNGLLLTTSKTKILKIFIGIGNFISCSKNYTQNRLLNCTISGFGGLEVACWPLVLEFAGSNPAEAVGFFRATKSSARLPSEGK